VTARERWAIAWRTARWARVGTGMLHHSVENIAAWGSGLQSGPSAVDRTFPMPVHTVSLRSEHPSFAAFTKAIRQKAIARCRSCRRGMVLGLAVQTDDPDSECPF
jgi:hypothetical protein